MPAVPLRQILEQLRRGEDGGIVKRTGKELNADREVLRCEAAGNADCRQTTEVADPAEGIGEGQVGLEVRLHRRRRDRKGGRGEDVEPFEQFVDLPLE